MTKQQEIAKQIKKYAAVVQNYYKRFNRTISKPRNKTAIYRAVLSLSVLLLFATSLYAGKLASDTYSTNSNAVILTQQFSEPVQLPSIVPGPHATLIIIPVVYLQGHLPYHYASFTLVNVALVVLTTFGWAFVLIKLFGRRYEIPIIVFISSLIFTSVAFSLSLAYTTIRNIEYPIVLWFVLIVSDVLRGRRYPRRQWIAPAIGSVLFAIVLAGDSFFNYAILLPLLVVMAWFWMQSRQFTANMGKAIGLIAASVVGAHLLKLILDKTGLIYFDYGFWGANSILPLEKIWAAVGIALTQTMQLHGANIFGQVIDPVNFSIFINFGLLLASLAALILILKQAGQSYSKRKAAITGAEHEFVFVTMAISFFIVFIIYAISGYAIATTPTGQIIDVHNARYISLMPLISVIGIIWLIKKYYSQHIALIAIVLLIVTGGIATSIHKVDITYADRSNHLEISPSRASVDSLMDILKTNNVKQVSADYWFGPIIRFWGDNKITSTPQSGCNEDLLKTDASSFTRQKGVNVALIVNRITLNYAFWSCTDEQLEAFYGTPDKFLQVPGSTPNTTIDIWIYKN